MYPAETTLPSLGVNVPSLAINTHLSFDFLHYEDSLIDCVHLMRAGTENAEKIFIIISRRDTSKCMAEVVSEIKRLRRRHAGSRSVWGDPKCNLPLQHRNVCVSTGWLDTMGIVYTCVRLLPGDLVYIGVDSLYQEVNLGLSIVESVDVGGLAWNWLSTSFTLCPCDLCENTIIESCSKTHCQMIAFKDSEEDCQVGASEFSTSDPEAMVAHVQGHTATVAKDRMLICDLCSKVLGSRETLRKHKNNVHWEPRKRVKCDCGKTFSYNYHFEHRKECDAYKNSEKGEKKKK